MHRIASKVTAGAAATLAASSASCYCYYRRDSHASSGNVTADAVRPWFQDVTSCDSFRRGDGVRTPSRISEFVHVGSASPPDAVSAVRSVPVVTGSLKGGDEGVKGGAGFADSVVKKESPSPQGGDRGSVESEQHPDDNIDHCKLPVSIHDSRVLKHYPSATLPSYENIYLREGYLASVSYRNKIPNWVAERIGVDTIQGPGSRAGLLFKADQQVPLPWRASTEEYRQRWYSRGHLAAAAGHKNSQEDMEATFLLSSNIIPQELSANCADWYRLEVYTRLLTRVYGDVYVISGPLWLPSGTGASPGRTVEPSAAAADKAIPTVHSHEDTQPQLSNQISFCAGGSPTPSSSASASASASSSSSSPPSNAPVPAPSPHPSPLLQKVTYEVIGARQIAAPTHTFKVVFATGARKKQLPPLFPDQHEPAKDSLVPSKDLPPVAIAAFIVPNSPERNDYPLEQFQVPLGGLEILSGLDFSGLLDFAVDAARVTPSHLSKGKDEKTIKRARSQHCYPFISFGARDDYLDTADLCKTKWGCNIKSYSRIVRARYLGKLKLSKSIHEATSIYEEAKEKGYKDDQFLKREFDRIVERMTSLAPKSNLSRANDKRQSGDSGGVSI
eukprot:GHVU01115438.1.p1 GENE.GHVU01115438.1~~GHVU01115438.1.p1  ORF type:complete len:615 (-),score=71.43 GHVU01115438.1:2534-4378(-)